MLYRKFLLQGIFVFIMMASITMSGYSQTTNMLLEVKATNTVIIDDFDVRPESYESIHNVSWEINASRYITKTDTKPYPQHAFPNEIPNILPRTLDEKNPDDMRVMGIRAAFNIKGNNSIELIPTDANTKGKVGIFTKEDETPLPGIFFDAPIIRMGVFALGILRDYSVWAEFETYTGTQFEVKLGDLSYRGWGLLEAQIPVQYYTRDDALSAQYYVLKLNKIVIRTGSTERVDDFIVYLDMLYYLKPFVSEDEYYDGYDLMKPGRADKFDWQSEDSESGSDSDSQ